MSGACSACRRGSTKCRPQHLKRPFEPPRPPHECSRPRSPRDRPTLPTAPPSEQPQKRRMRIRNFIIQDGISAPPDSLVWEDVMLKVCIAHRIWRQAGTIYRFRVLKVWRFSNLHLSSHQIHQDEAPMLQSFKHLTHPVNSCRNGT